MSLIASHETDAAVRKARAWRNNAPTDLLAVIALGEAFEAAKDLVGAARAYGSIIDLFPERAEMRRFASGHLERVDSPEAIELARDALSKAMADRPDHLTTYRMLAYVLLKQGSQAEAFGVLRKALTVHEERNRPGVVDALREDIGLVAAAWAKVDPGRRADIDAMVVAAGGVPETEPSLRFALTWETDANDVDLLVTPWQDPASGNGRLYENVTNGYGPEVYAVRGRVRAESYGLGARYSRSGPMGLGMGKLQIVEHDGKGGLRFDERPFMLRGDGAYADLGTYAG
jgi:tetratricopeptide (TPR) repeat protein